MNPSAQASLLLIGRVLLGLLFIISGMRAAVHFGGSAAYLASLGFPAPQAMNLLAIAVEIGAGALLSVGWQTRWAAWLLIAFVAVATAMAHRFWEFDAREYSNQLNHMLKNLAIIGGLFCLAVIGPGRYSLDGANPAGAPSA